MSTDRARHHGWMSATIPPAAVARPRVVEPIVLGSERQLDADADERAEIAVRDALTGWTMLATIRRRVGERYAWQAEDVLARLEAAGRVERSGNTWRIVRAHAAASPRQVVAKAPASRPSRDELRATIDDARARRRR